MRSVVVGLVSYMVTGQKRLVKEKRNIKFCLLSEINLINTLHYIVFM